jgi:hypothetical protein
VIQRNVCEQAKTLLDNLFSQLAKRWMRAERLRQFEEQLAGRMEWGGVKRETPSLKAFPFTGIINTAMSTTPFLEKKATSEKDWSQRFSITDMRRLTMGDTF